MIGFSEAQIMAWLSPVIWPFLRILALFSVAPVFSQRAIPMRYKVGMALVIALGAQATLANQPVIAVNDPRAVVVAIQQVGIGLSVGFAARLIIASLEMAGEAIGLQMGLNFASFFDPVSGGQLSAVSRFLVQTFTLFFIVVNGHIFVLLAVIKSFEAFPVDGHFIDAVAQMRLHELGSALFSSALWLALPMMALLLFVNLTMGVITRIAPQMNIFAVGFPITLTLGMIGITATLPVMEQPFFRLLEQVFAVFGV
ncbi:MAG TPA: flagellar biosynthetic protein FliR [Comamonas denitrificans]|nr:flagellar biosynthetic protein FliR [Comamonas sp.]HRF20759.1 flagellar biosynthetic protein FliR [Comamonas denitrificans]